MKRRLREGLPYGWWKNPDNAAMIIWLVCCALLAAMILGWYIDEDAWW